MKLSLLLALLSINAFAQIDTGTGSNGACTHLTPALLAGGTLNCTTLTISATPNFNVGADALIIKVQGAVTISGALDLSGEAGINVRSDLVPELGGAGGPGAGDGGGTDAAGTFESGEDLSIASGDGADQFDIDCGDGGGGAGFAVAGTGGTACPAGPGTPGNAGQIVPASEFSFSGIFRGGFGGGAGADGGDSVLGPGGGGGGAIHIIAGGDVTITGSIIANGGDGGTGDEDIVTPIRVDGGGGGAGSGGVIWIQSLGQIVHAGNMEANGGTGGSAPEGGTGGNGGYGFIQLEDLDGIITGGGTLPGYEIVTTVPASIGAPRLSSDISCGMIKPAGEEDHSPFFQMIMGFLLVISASFFIKRLKFFSKTQI